jgi:hypothetical protein
MNKFYKTLKNKKFLLIAGVVFAFIIIGLLVIDRLAVKPPQLYISSEFSKTIQAVRGGYSWTNGHRSLIVDAIAPTEFQYTDENTLNLERGAPLILNTKRLKFNRQYPFTLLNLQCFDAKNQVVSDYQAWPDYVNGGLYLKAPAKNGVYLCNVVLQYKQGTVNYGYKLAVADSVARIDSLYANKAAYIGDNSKVSAIIHNLIVPNQLSWGGLELQTASEPYGLTLNYSLSDATSKNFDSDSLSNSFQKNSVVIFSLVSNVENITINLKQGSKVTTFNYSREEINKLLGQDVRNFIQTKESFKNLILQLGV